MPSPRQPDPHVLSPRRREVLALLAEGLSNEAIAQRLRTSERTVEKHVAAIFRALELPPDPSRHRRVQAALAWMAGERGASGRWVLAPIDQRGSANDSGRR
jgi:DNA-binding NarL/FixJ family response regulator